MSPRFPPPCVMGDESIMSRKNHGTSETPVMKNLRWGCNWETADRICNFNRHYAEYSGYYEKTDFVKHAQALNEGETIHFFDSNTGKLLFTAPVGRTMDQFLQESRAHGWPSFRDQETNWEYVRCLPDGETVSVDGTHLGALELRACIRSYSSTHRSQPPGRKGVTLLHQPGFGTLIYMLIEKKEFLTKS